LRGVGRDPDIVAADGDGDQIGVGMDGSDLGRHRTLTGLLRPAADIGGGRARAGHVGEAAR